MQGTLVCPCAPGTSRLPRFEGLKGMGRPATAAVAHAPRPIANRLPLRIDCVRVAGVEIPNQKRIETSLTYVYGIGKTTAQKILADTGVENKRTHELDEAELTAIREYVEKLPVEGDLRRFVALNIKRLKDIGCYRGYRHIHGLPCHGQRTKTNARTRKGKRVPMQAAGKR